VNKRSQKKIKQHDLLIELWWEPGYKKFQACVRDDNNDDGWSAMAESPSDAIDTAIQEYELSKMHTESVVN
jgi:hypothetical protein